jgi:hypothetical protein
MDISRRETSYRGSNKCSLNTKQVVAEGRSLEAGKCIIYITVSSLHFRDLGPHSTLLIESRAADLLMKTTFGNMNTKTSEAGGTVVLLNVEF